MSAHEPISELLLSNAKVPTYDRAIKEFETSLKTDPKHEPTLYNLSIADFKMGDFEKSQNALKQLEKANPNSKLIEKLKKIINPS